MGSPAGAKAPRPQALPNMTFRSHIDTARALRPGDVANVVEWLIDAADALGAQEVRGTTRSRQGGKISVVHWTRVPGTVLLVAADMLARVPDALAGRFGLPSRQLVRAFQTLRLHPNLGGMAAARNVGRLIDAYRASGAADERGDHPPGVALKALQTEEEMAAETRLRSAEAAVAERRTIRHDLETVVSRETVEELLRRLSTGQPGEAERLVRESLLRPMDAAQKRMAAAGKRRGPIRRTPKAEG